MTASVPYSRHSRISRALLCSGVFNGMATRDCQTSKGTNRRQKFKRYHHDSHNELRCHLSDVLCADNFARRLKTLRGLTPDEYIRKIRASEPDRFIVNPVHQMPGPNS